ncbi:MAG: 30S ribosomal protein S12 methylthiotransferase RimO [Lachnospiraceae bacterium]|nr:30S ribosomal protein S12 methylthiotransferase RimO [Lachnospiraceae bacterium]
MKIFFVSLGCDKNLVDSEMMLGELAKAGHEIVDDETIADIAVVNSCSFISDAKKESIETLIEMGNLKETHGLKGLICCGCLSQRYSEEIKEQIPEVDAIIGTMAIDEIVKAVNYIEENYKNKSAVKEYIKPIDGPIVYGKERLLTTGGHYAYLKISEGCDKHCTYCAIPKMRGTYRSVPMEVLVNEAKKLADGGVKELILVAQETTLYGVDLYKEKSLPKLLRELSKIDDIKAIRILYCYPEEITDDLINEMRDNEKVVHYLDMPIQSGADRVLKRMGRKTDAASIIALVEKLREKIPDICLRTTLISGFPKETFKDFLETKAFVKKIRFDRLGVFAYSREEGTAADKMSGQVLGFVKKLRRDSLMRTQRSISFEKAKAEVGRDLDVFVEGHIPEDNVYVCRTYKDAPNVDGYLFLETNRELMSGDIIKAHVTGAKEYDLMGVLKDEFTE